MRPVRPLELGDVTAVVQHDGAGVRHRVDDVWRETRRHERVAIAPEEERGPRQCPEAVPEPVLAVRLFGVSKMNTLKTVVGTVKLLSHLAMLRMFGKSRAIQPSLSPAELTPASDEFPK